MRHYQLKLSNQSAQSYLENLTDGIENKYHINTIFVNEPCGTGRITTDQNHTPLLLIGTQISKLPFTPMPKTPLSDTKFLKMITTVFHELAHYYQQTSTYQKTNPSNDDVYMTMREIATLKNPFYYKPSDMHNYVYDPTEIMAEYQGIMQTYNYLQNEFEDIPANTKEQIMVNFVNHCQKAPYYWIHSKKPLQSMEEIENAFEIAYKTSKFIKRKYFEYENQNEILDENMRFMKQYPEIIQRFENANTGYQQDKIMACIACYLHPGFKEYYQSIQSVDLSPKTVLDMQLPEEPFFDYHPEIKHDRTAALAFYEEKFNTEPPNFDNDFDYP